MIFFTTNHQRYLPVMVDGSIVQSESLLPDQDAHLQEGEEQVEDEPEDG